MAVRNRCVAETKARAWPPKKQRSLEHSMWPWALLGPLMAVTVAGEAQVPRGRGLFTPLIWLTRAVAREAGGSA